MGIILLFVIVILFALPLAICMYGAIGLLILTLIQWLLGVLIKAVTGEKPDWIFSKVSCAVEVVIVAALLLAYCNIPLHPAQIDAEECAFVYTSAAEEPGVDEPYLSHKENIEALTELLADVKVSPNILYTKQVLEDAQKNAHSLYFYDAEGNFLKKVCYVDNLLGVSNKEDGKYTFYDCSESVYEQVYSAREEIRSAELELTREEDNADAFEALQASFQYADGTYTFTVPAFAADSWNLDVRAFERTYTQTIMGDDGYVMSTGDETDTAYFLTEHTEAADWQVGEQYSFSLDAEKTYDSVYCIVTIGDSEFRFDFPEPDEQYLADPDNPVTYHVYSY